MKTVKVTCENGVSWSTSVSDNSTPESIKGYFVGQMFNVGSYPDEIMTKCISAELITEKDDIQVGARVKHKFRDNMTGTVIDVFPGCNKLYNVDFGLEFLSLTCPQDIEKI